MAQKLTGIAVIFAFRGTVAFSGSGTFIKESGDFEHDYQLDELTDDDKTSWRRSGIPRNLSEALFFLLHAQRRAHHRIFRARRRPWRGRLKVWQ
jgi:hypothetical protein